jgi:alkanesulfonate monooxygenase SsuD/methylene tetrahydromethanopterin reductase-like flavin-dependent oxidoreductase (luciferase family)
MKIGLFDHVEDGARPVAQLFDERIEFAAAADKAGFYCLHVAEHHATPLNLVPVPGIYLGAVARETKHLRLGPLVYLLPLYSPLRLMEEICMLDHLSHGRLDIGVGRGVSPYELEFHNVVHDDSRDIFFEAYECVRSGLVSETFSFKTTPTTTCRSRCGRCSSRIRRFGTPRPAKSDRPGPASTDCIM